MLHVPAFDFIAYVKYYAHYSTPYKAAAAELREMVEI